MVCQLPGMPISKQFSVGIKSNVTASLADNSIELCFYDLIQNPEYFDWSTMQLEEGNLVADIIGQVKAYNPSKIKMEIDCMGGDLGKAIAIYNFLKDFPARIECKIMGFCASAGTVLSSAASPGKLVMPVNGFFITHASSIWNVGGTSKELREAAEINDKYTSTMAEILAARNTKGHTAEEILALWENGDCWMSGKDAEEYGFVDSCYNETAIVTARIKEATEAFKNAPASITATIEEPTNNDSILSKIENTMKNFSELVTAAIGKITGVKVTAKVGEETDITAMVTAAIQPALVDLAANMQTEVTAEIAGITEKVTTDVTAAMEDKYKTVIAELQKSVTDLTTDLTALAGKESRPGAKGATQNEKNPERKGLGVA